MVYIVYSFHSHMNILDDCFMLFEYSYCILLCCHVLNMNKAQFYFESMEDSVSIKSRRKGSE